MWQILFLFIYEYIQVVLLTKGALAKILLYTL